MHSLQSPVIHRDVKGGNVLLHDEGDGNLIAKVSDFGTVRVNEEQNLVSPEKGILKTSKPTHINTDSMPGTKPYKPPGVRQTVFACLHGVYTL